MAPVNPPAKTLFIPSGTGPLERSAGVSYEGGMDDRNAKIISLRERRAQDAERRRRDLDAARAAERRRKLAEYGPGAGRAGRVVGIFGAVLILALLGIGLILAVWMQVRRLG